MIAEPINDVDCLGQLTTIARELAPTTLVREVARRLGSPAAVVRWLQSLPQENDDGGEGVRFIQCDVPQRVRLLPDDPNCVERSVGALMLLEVLDPSTARALATVDRPLRHTGLVEKRGQHWQALDLFPRRNGQRNFDWGNFGKDVLQGVHQYVGKPILSFYGLGGVADTLGENEDKWIGRDKKPPEKKNPPPPNGPRQQPEQPKPKPQPSAAQPKQGRFSFATRIIGTGAAPAQPSPKGGGGKDAEETKQVHAGAAPGDGAPAGGDHSSPAQEGEEAPRHWWWDAW